MMLTVRSYAGETDLQAIANLLNACEAVDRLDDYFTVTDLRVEFNNPFVDPSRDLRLWEDGNGMLVGFGQMWMPQATDDVDGWLWFRVHPAARGKTLEADIIRWAEARMREAAQTHGQVVKLRTSCRDNQSDRVQLLEKEGFAVDRQFLSMIKSLIPPIPAPQFPDGFTLSHVKTRNDAAAWVEAHNQSFIDHWNYHSMSVDEHCYWIENDLNYRPELDLVAIAPSGAIAAFCHCHIDREYNTYHGCNEGWIAILGTRRGFRRLGLGRAMLLAGMQRLWDAGTDTVRLGVDTQNPNQALHLYESVGFRKFHTRLNFVKQL